MCKLSAPKDIPLSSQPELSRAASRDRTCLLDFLLGSGPPAARLTSEVPSAGNAMTSSERPSPEPLPKREASPAVLGAREFWKCSGGFKCLEL